jgi:hypothetical protein
MSWWIRVSVVAVTILLVSAPVGAQWSATMTVGDFEEDARVGFRAPGDNDDDPSVGALSDVDFDFKDATYEISWLAQLETSGHVIITIEPSMSEQDFRSLTLMADGIPLELAALRIVPDAFIQVSYDDPGFRWTVGQRVAVGLIEGSPVPALPLAATWLLGLMLAIAGRIRWMGEKNGY